MSLDSEYECDSEFLKLLTRRSDIDLTTVALELARDAYPELDFRVTFDWIDECGEDAQAFVTAAFEQVLARPATPKEIETSVEFLSEQVKFFEKNRSRLSIVAEDPGDVSKPSGDPALRARENLVHVLFNHNDFVTIR